MKQSLSSVRMKRIGAASSPLNLAILCISLATVSHSNGVQSRFIVGGTRSSAAAVPHLAQLKIKQPSGYMCSGAIVGDRWILTAARCVEDRPFRVAVGLDYIQEFDSRMVPVAARYIHPHYQWTPSVGQRGDLALIELLHKLEYNERVQPIALPKKNEELKYVGKEDMVTVAGFGLNAAEGFPMNRSSAVNITIYDGKKGCEKSITFNERSHICAGSLNGIKGVCRGDAGSPLFVATKERTVILGVASVVDGCARPGSAAIFTKVSNYLDWIHSIIAHY